MRIVLVDIDLNMVDAWRIAFDGTPVEVHHGSIFDIKDIDAYVSPANSFGFMDGGIDQAYINKFGDQLQRLARMVASNDPWCGEIPVGAAAMLVIPHAKADPDEARKRLIMAPTMRAPEDVSKTINAYLAFRAALVCAKRYDATSIACPGLGTLTGRMPVYKCAWQMRRAYDNFTLSWEPDSTPSAIRNNECLRRL